MRANGRIFGVRLSLLLWLPAQRIPEEEPLIFRRRTGDAQIKSRAFLRSTCPRTAIKKLPIKLLTSLIPRAIINNELKAEYGRMAQLVVHSVRIT